MTPGGIDEIAALIEHYSGYRPTVTGPPARASDVAKALRKNKVIVAALPNAGGGGHVVIVRGIRRESGGVQVLVNDPMSKRPYVVDFATFRNWWSQSIIVQFAPDNSSDRDEDDDD